MEHRTDSVSIPGYLKYPVGVAVGLGVGYMLNRHAAGRAAAKAIRDAELAEMIRSGSHRSVWETMYDPRKYPSKAGTLSAWKSHTDLLHRSAELEKNIPWVGGSSTTNAVKNRVRHKLQRISGEYYKLVAHPEPSLIDEHYALHNVYAHHKAMLMDLREHPEVVSAHPAAKALLDLHESHPFMQEADNVYITKMSQETRRFDPAVGAIVGGGIGSAAAGLTKVPARYRPFGAAAGLAIGAGTQMYRNSLHPQGPDPYPSINYRKGVAWGAGLTGAAAAAVMSIERKRPRLAEGDPLLLKEFPEFLLEGGAIGAGIQGLHHIMSSSKRHHD